MIIDWFSTHKNLCKAVLFHIDINAFYIHGKRGYHSNSGVQIYRICHRFSVVILMEKPESTIAYPTLKHWQWIRFLTPWPPTFYTSMLPSSPPLRHQYTMRSLVAPWCVQCSVHIWYACSWSPHHWGKINKKGKREIAFGEGKTLVFTGISAAGCKANIIATYIYPPGFIGLWGRSRVTKAIKWPFYLSWSRPGFCETMFQRCFELRHYAAVMRLAPSSLLSPAP